MPLTQVSSRLIEDTLRYVLGANGSSDYTFTGPGLSGTVNDPTLTLSRGHTYIFENRNSSGAHPFYIKTSIANGGTNDAYNTGVTNNGGAGGTEIVFTVPHDAPDLLYYQCSSHSSMAGQLKIAGAVADGSITESKLADDAVTADKLANSINTAIAANTAKDLTALSASNLTSGTVPDARFPATLPAASGANLTNLPPNRVNRNLIINGACLIAQRQTSTTSADDYSVDRWKFYHTGTDEAPTCSQADVASGTTPYTLGFRKAFKFLNGNQTSGAGVGDMIRFQYSIEAQDLANSGWNYTSSSSNATLSFWVKSSVAQNFFGRLQASDSSPSLGYAFETGSLVADTWTKVTKTISGATGLAFNNDNGNGLIIEIAAFQGTNFTGSMSLNTWGGFVSGTRTPDNTSTWYTTNDATLEFTGLQLEVGSVATDFEHRSFAQELALCQRYYYRLAGDDTTIATGHQNGAYGIFPIQYPQEMRAQPTGTAQTVTDAYSYYYEGSVARVSSVNLAAHNNRHGNLESTSYNTSNGTVGLFRITNSSAYIDISAEL